MGTASPVSLTRTRFGPWFFVVMINDLKMPGQSFLMRRFADDTIILEIVPSSKESHLKDAVDYINNRAQENRLQLNPTKCKVLVTSFTRTTTSHPRVELGGVKFSRVSTAKVLGVMITDDLKWNDQVGAITQRQLNASIFLGT